MTKTQGRRIESQISGLSDHELMAAARGIWDLFAHPLGDRLLAEIERRGLSV